MANRSITINTPNGSIQHLSEEQLVIAGLATELAAAAESYRRIAGMRDEVGSAQWVGLVSGTAEESGFLADRIHDARRALQAYCDEHRGDISTPTRRDISVRRGAFVSTIRIVFLSIGGGLVAASGVVGFGTAYPHVALMLLTGAAFCTGLATNLPQPKS